MSFNVITPTPGLALGARRRPRIADGLGWRAVAVMFDRERLVAGQPDTPDVVTTEQAKGSTGRRLKMPATLRLTHKAIGVEVRRGTFDVVVDGERAGSVEMNDTIEIPVEPGRRTLQVRNGRNSSRTLTFDAAEGEVVAFRCTGKRFLPIFLASFVVPSLALTLRRE